MGPVLRVQHGDLLLELLEGVQVVEPRWQVMEPSGELVPPGLVEFIAGVELADVLTHPRAKTARW